MTEIFNLPLPSPVELVRRYGGPVSHAALDPSRSIFRTPGIEGLICFLVVRRCAVVLGDPVCAPEHKISLADAFASYCSNNGWSILYSTVTAAMHAYASERSYAAMEFAGLLMADPQHDPEADHRGHHLRQHLNHARRTGVIVREYLGQTTPDARLEAQAGAACEQWRAARQGLQLHLGRPRLFDDRPGRRWFIAEQAGSVVGMLSMLRINYFECHNLINIVFSSPAAPLYTNELMVVAALGALRDEGIHSVCLGVGPLAALGRVDGFGGITEFLSRRIYRLTAKMINLHGRTVFWEKFHLTHRDPLYLLFQSPHIGLSELNALLRAFNFSVT
jgi:lysylphosphatidylglycerol synthetase-like protein (DUF2156 family)